MSALGTRKARPPATAPIPGTVGRLIYLPSLYAYLDDLAKAEKM
jgi:hypothetical protein